MRKTDSFRRQHDEIGAVVTQMRNHLNADELAKDATAMFDLVVSLRGQLKVHLAMEDKTLYPRLLANDETKATAQKFMDEMGTLGGVLADYIAKWPRAESAQTDPHGFIADTTGLLNALVDRVERENSDLYELADRS